MSNDTSMELIDNGSSDFDSVTQISAVAYCNSNEYASYVTRRKDESTLWHLVYCFIPRWCNHSNIL